MDWLVFIILGLLSNAYQFISYLLYQSKQNNYILVSLMTQRKRHASLRQLPHIRNPTMTHPPPAVMQQKTLQTISQQKQLKKNSTKDLTHLISKFTLATQTPSLHHSQQLVRSTIAVIRGFSQTENNFQTLFIQLYSVLRRFCFVFEDPEIEALLARYNVRGGYSFRRTCFMLDAELGNVMKDKDEKIKDIEEMLAQLKTELTRKEVKWVQQEKFLKSQVQRYKKLADIQYMKSLQQKVQYLTTIKQQLQLQCTQLTKQNDQYLKQIDAKQTLIHQQSFQLSKLNSQLFDTRLALQNTETYLHKMRDRFDQLLVKMMGIKEVIRKVEDENEMLVSERMGMVNRAAVGFQGLTPRPKYNEIFGGSVRGVNSTQEIFKNLVQRSGLDKKEIMQKVVLRKKNNRLQEAQAIRDKVVDDIILAKKQMDKL